MFYNFKGQLYIPDTEAILAATVTEPRNMKHSEIQRHSETQWSTESQDYVTSLVMWSLRFINGNQSEIIQMDEKLVT